MQDSKETWGDPTPPTPAQPEPRGQKTPVSRGLGSMGHGKVAFIPARGPVANRHRPGPLKLLLVQRNLQFGLGT